MTDMDTLSHPTHEALSDYVDSALSADETATVAAHLQTCGACARFVAELRALVAGTQALPVLDPPERVWDAICRELVAERQAKRPSPVDLRLSTFDWRRAAWALATAALVVFAFLVGRIVEQRHQANSGFASVGASQSGKPIVNASASDEAMRQRVLLVAVGDHLERSQMVLVELANVQARGATADISDEQDRADDLLASNRLYRQTAEEIGQTKLAALLDDLERVLVEVAHSPSELSMQQLADIQQRIEAQGILFRIKIIGSDVKELGNNNRKQPVS